MVAIRQAMMLSLLTQVNAGSYSAGLPLDPEECTVMLQVSTAQNFAKLDNLAEQDNLENPDNFDILQKRLPQPASVKPAAPDAFEQELKEGKVEPKETVRALTQMVVNMKQHLQQEEQLTGDRANRQHQENVKREEEMVKELVMARDELATDMEKRNAKLDNLAEQDNSQNPSNLAILQERLPPPASVKLAAPEEELKEGKVEPKETVQALTQMVVNMNQHLQQEEQEIVDRANQQHQENVKRQDEMYKQRVKDRAELATEMEKRNEKAKIEIKKEHDEALQKFALEDKNREKLFREKMNVAMAPAGEQVVL